MTPCPRCAELVRENEALKKVVFAAKFYRRFCKDTGPVELSIMKWGDRLDAALLALAPAQPEACSWHKERGQSYEKCVADHLAPEAKPCQHKWDSLLGWNPETKDHDKNVGRRCEECGIIAPPEAGKSCRKCGYLPGVFPRIDGSYEPCSACQPPDKEGD